MRVALVVSVVLAIGTSFAAWWPESEAEAPQTDTSAELFNRGDAEVDPASVASLEVSTWDADAQAPEKFQVAKKGPKWVIPSHFDYPADGGTRVGQTAGSVLNIRRGPQVSDDAKRHGEFGVVDPLGSATAEADARGKRITLKDAGGASLVDLIIGKKAEHANVHYVRDADEDSVYTANVNPDIRTAFKEWVETDLLKILETDIRSITIDDHSVDEERGVVEDRGRVVVEKPRDAEDWSSASTPEGKELDGDVVSDMLDEITGLRLAGVRPYSNMWLEKRGFYPLQDGSLRGNEGAIQVTTRDGVIYHLFFGEIALGDSEDTSADAAIAPESAGTAPRDGHNRYMAVFAQYSPKRDEERPQDGEDGGDDAEERPGAKKAREKGQRFGTFFYVIDDDSFGKLKPALDALWKDPEPEEEGGDGEGSMDDASSGDAATDEAGAGTPAAGDAEAEPGSGADDKTDDGAADPVPDDNPGDGSGGDAGGDPDPDGAKKSPPPAPAPVPPAPTPPPANEPK